MALSSGTRIGQYEILDAIGAGGMGEVYRARDTRLNRDVAIKILPPQFAQDAERLARFEREAQVLASLNHPNVAQIYGVEETAGRSALVMELVEGEDLALYIGRNGRLALEETVNIARQIADALECAHEQGIVHRDLKPANVKVRDDGTVKVLDFGLAKLTDATSISPSSSPVLSPTITSPATQLGVILGTAAYMAPEQARGKAVDKRADVWAFGLVVYEMLTGRRAFSGSEVSDTLAFILTKDPDWSALPPATPPAVHRLLRRCLQKERKQRLADISDARIELNEALTPAEATQPSPFTALARRSGWFVLAIAAALLLLMAIGGAVGAWLFRTSPPSGRVVRYTLPLEEDLRFTNTGRHAIAISPDGSRIVFVANHQLYLRSMDAMKAQPIPIAEPSRSTIGPTFSPDGRFIIYYGDGALRKIPISGGPPVTLATIGNPFGLHWTGGTVFAGLGRGGIVRIPDGGGQPEPVVKVSGAEWAQGPRLLPGNEWIIFTFATGAFEERWDDAQIVAQSLRSGERKVLIEGGADARYVATGHLLYAKGGVVYAVSFDPRTASVKGSPRPVLEGVRRSPVTGAAQFATSENGTMIHLSGPVTLMPSERRLGFLDWAGKTSVLETPSRSYETPRIAPDGTRAAFVIATEKESDVWIYEISGKSALRRLTFGGRNRAPVWSPDGRHVIFQSDREGDNGLYVQSADVSGGATRVTKAEKDTTHIANSWSPDGESVAVQITGTPLLSSVQILSMKDKTLRPFHPDGRRAGSAAFSPDGRWLAYAAVIGTGGAQVFVEPFPATGARYQIGSGIHPVWSHDGHQLVVNPAGPAYATYRIATEPRFSFAEGGRIRRDGTFTGNPGTPRNYDVMPDGKRLLIVLRASVEDPEPREIYATLNWFEELRRN